MRRKKIGLIGRVDPSGRLFDGQTVKTRTMYNMLKKHYGEDSIVLVDTLEYKKRALFVVVDLIKCMLGCDAIFVSLSRNGRRFFFPVLSFFSKTFGKRIYHNLIGGWLAKDLEDFPRWVSYLNSFEVNWVESYELVEKLESAGVCNSKFLPNFKDLSINQDEYVVSGSPFKLCTFSRVVENKGISDAISAIQKLNSRESGFKYTLDIYGPIDEAYESEFERLVKQAPDVSYLGCIKPEESVDVVKQYHALLFPTKWYLEGMPGTILDALFAGVPVIASRWRYYSEMLEDGVTGYSYPFGEQEMLCSAILQCFEEEANLAELHEGCLSAAEKYKPETVFQQMISEVKI